ncbi:MAG: hypothetical protein NVSMB31_16440 [Vulcanimicrobiaceae bacterium]
MIAAIDVLAGAGVAVYDAPDAPKPLRPVDGSPSPLRFTRWQARTLALQVAFGGGFLGSRLDEVVATPKKVPTFSGTLAAWVTRYDGAGAKSAGEIMGKQDWQHAPNVVFPAIVLALFLADVARAHAKKAAGSTGGPRLAMIPVTNALAWLTPQGRAVAASDPCSAAADFLSGTIADVVSALQFKGSSQNEFLAFLAFLWNQGLVMAGGVLKAVINNVLKPLTEILQQIATAVGIVTQVVSALQAWSVGVHPTGAGEHGALRQVMRFQIGDEPLNSSTQGVFIATIETGKNISWPGWLIGCAAQYGVDLAAAPTSDSTVSWRINDGIPQYARESSRSDRVTVTDEKNEAYFAFITNKETPQVAAKGAPDQGVLSVEVSIRRVQLEKLKLLVEHLILDQLPQRLANELYPYFKQFITPLEDKLLNLINAPIDGVGAVLINFHDAADVVPSASPSPVVTKRVDPCSRIDGGTAAILGAKFVVGPIQSSKEPGAACTAWGSGGGVYARDRLSGGFVIVTVVTPDELRRKAPGIAATCMQMGADTLSKCHDLESRMGGGGTSAVKNGVLVTAGAMPAGSKQSSIPASRAVLQHALKLMR